MLGFEDNPGRSCRLCPFLASPWFHLQDQEAVAREQTSALQYTPKGDLSAMYHGGSAVLQNAHSLFLSSVAMFGLLGVPETSLPAV